MNRLNWDELMRNGGPSYLADGSNSGSNSGYSGGSGGGYSGGYDGGRQGNRGGNDYSGGYDGGQYGNRGGNGYAPPYAYQSNRASQPGMTNQNWADLMRSLPATGPEMTAQGYGGGYGNGYRGSHGPQNNQGGQFDFGRLSQLLNRGPQSSQPNYSASYNGYGGNGGYGGGYGNSMYYPQF